jgi:multiple sugar transport system permease protein
MPLPACGSGGREALFLIYLAALMVPSQVTLIPNFILIKTLGWIDTYQGLILPYAFSSFGTFLLRQYLKSIPAELLEAARIDGASHAQIYLTIVLPLAKPALGALAIFTFVAQWNNFLWPLITTTKPDMQVAIVALATLQVPVQYRLAAADDRQRHRHRARCCWCSCSATAPSSRG